MPDGRGGCTWFLLASIPEEHDHGTAPWVYGASPKNDRIRASSTTSYSIVAKMYHSTGGVLGVLRVLRACCGPKFVLLI